RGHAVRVLVRRGSDTSDLAGLGVELHEGDVTLPASLESAVQGCDGVFHLAGVVGYSKSQRPLMERVNVGGTENVLAALRKHPVQRLVHMSSVTAVGASFDGKTPLNEDHPFNLSSLDLGYFETKKQAEDL